MHTYGGERKEEIPMWSEREDAVLIAASFNNDK